MHRTASQDRAGNIETLLPPHFRKSVTQNSANKLQYCKILHLKFYPGLTTFQNFRIALKGLKLQHKIMDLRHHFVTLIWPPPLTEYFFWQIWALRTFRWGEVARMATTFTKWEKYKILRIGRAGLSGNVASSYSTSSLHQGVTNIWIFEYIQIFADTNIASYHICLFFLYKYIRIFICIIFLYEYIRIFVRIIFFIQIY